MLRLLQTHVLGTRHLLSKQCSKQRMKAMNDNELAKIMALSKSILDKVEHA